MSDAASGEAPRTSALEDQVPGAFERWARGVFAAPRRPAELITDVRACDEVVERLVTRVTRRDLRELRTRTSERRSTASRVLPSTVDPFQHTTATLREASQHIAQCDACAASGVLRCERCRGNGAVVCGNCAGSGKQRSDNTNRLINCKVCKKAGRVMCAPCVGAGTLACQQCYGSGHELAWLTFEETEHSLISVLPSNSPVVAAHRSLAEATFLQRGDLLAFSVVDEQRSQGELDALPPPHDALPRAQRAAMDSRLERIEAQQYLRLAVARRDVTYEMAGTRGTVALSGTTLLGATTAEAVRPIRRRLWLWLALTGLVLALGLLLRAKLVGSSAYFAASQRLTAGLALGAAALVVPVFGAVLRAWRGGARFRPIAAPVRILAGGAILALAGIAVVGAASRPSAEEVATALAANDLAGARLALAALRERGPTAETEALEDRVLMGEAARLQGPDRIRKLDEVAARRGAGAAAATSAARVERLALVQAALGRQDSAAALAALSADFAGDTSDEVAEARARAHELQLATCGADACRLAAAARAQLARPSGERAAQVASLRTRVLEALGPARVTAGAGTRQRLEQLRELRDLGAQVLEASTDDPELRAAATAATELAVTERAKVPLLRADLGVIEELLGKSHPSRSGAPRIDLGGALAHFAFDAARRCNAIYVIDEKLGKRTGLLETWPADAFLAQVFGKPVKLKRPATLTETVALSEGGYAIVARWRRGELAELRIGHATP